MAGHVGLNNVSNPTSPSTGLSQESDQQDKVGSTQQSADRHLEQNCRDHGCEMKNGKTFREGNFKDSLQRKGSTVQ